MGGSHAPNFATGAAALSYINSLNSQVADGSIIDYMAPVRSLKRNVEGGPRTYATKYQNVTYSIGLRGDLNDDWRYDISYQTSEVDFSEEIQNDLSITPSYTPAPSDFSENFDLRNCQTPQSA